MGHSRKQNKRKNIFTISIISLVIITVLLIVSFFSHKQEEVIPKSLGTNIKGNNYYLEIASTVQDQKKGLSERNELCSNCGMLFSFEKSGQHDFWMKNTHFPLDIIWLDSKQQIVKIITAAKNDSETIYTNKTPAQYVIELPANESLKLNLQIGDTIPIFND